MNHNFNPLDWLGDANQKAINSEPLPVTKDKPPKPQQSQPSVAPSEIEVVITQIEDKQIDIAAAYSDWRDIGFAFADEFGENGRDYFHRVSKFYSDYSPNDCNKQYDSCLQAKGQGISISTFYFHAKKAGIKLRSRNETTEPDKKEKREKRIMPNLPDMIFSNLPDFLKQIIQHTTTNEERDILLLGSIVSISACLPGVHGLYGNNKVYPNLYIFITGQASAGKGILNHCKHLVNPVHRDLREQTSIAKSEYESELAEYNQIKNKDSSVQKPAKPPEMMLYIPANNSSTGAYQLLADSKGKGLIFETEGDTLAQAFKTDYGNYSDGFRKAFHHETISYFRRTDKEFVEIENPCISAMLSGTPNQIASLIPNAENGLFSRFMFYYMNTRYEWIDVFANTENGPLEDYFKELGDQFYQLYKILLANPPIQFKLSPQQQIQFNKFFAEMQEKYLALLGDDFIASIRRLGLITFRIAMIFSILRILESGDISNSITCDDQDFQTAMAVIQVLMKHSSQVFSELPEDSQLPKLKNLKEQFLDALPPTFNRQAYLQVADALGIKDKTAEGYITHFIKGNLLHRPKQDNYIKTNNYSS